MIESVVRVVGEHEIAGNVDSDVRNQRSTTCRAAEHERRKHIGLKRAMSNHARRPFAASAA